MATLEDEKKAQRERDLKFNFRRERAFCIGCNQIVQETIDGRCMACYEKLQNQIFTPCN